jgi:hypothetical protein
MQKIHLRATVKILIVALTVATPQKGDGAEAQGARFSRSARLESSGQHERGGLCLVGTRDCTGLSKRRARLCLLAALPCAGNPGKLEKIHTR